MKRLTFQTSAGGWAAALLVPLVLGMGCTTTPPPATNPEHLPSLKDIRPTVPRRQTAGATAEAAQLQSGARIYTIQMPLRQSTDAAWGLIDESAAGGGTAKLWHANGMRLGVVAESRLAGVLRRLPNTRGLKRTSVMGGAHPVPVRTSLPLAVALPVYLKAPSPLEGPKGRGGQQSKEPNHRKRGASSPQGLTSAPSRPQVIIKSKRVEMMLTMRPGAGGLISARLFPMEPNHNRTFLPQSAGHANASASAKPAGRLAPLAASLTPGPRNAIVIGLYRPWAKRDKAKGQDKRKNKGESKAKTPRPAQRAPNHSTSAPTATPSAPPDKLGDAAARLPGPPPLKINLGRALFTGYFGKTPTQLVFIISFDRARLRRR